MKPLYEQWRPLTFDDVAGQDEIIRKIHVATLTK